MARLYGVMKSEGHKEKTATSNSKLVAELRGWNAGVRVTCVPDGESSHKFFIHKTMGSNNPESQELIAEFTTYTGKQKK